MTFEDLTISVASQTTGFSPWSDEPFERHILRIRLERGDKRLEFRYYCCAVDYEPNFKPDDTLLLEAIEGFLSDAYTATEGRENWSREFGTDAGFSLANTFLAKLRRMFTDDEICDYATRLRDELEENHYNKA